VLKVVLIIKMKIPSLPGSYILIGKLDNKAQFISGPFSNQLITPGYYLYAGSAFGKGGLCARIARHLNPDTQKFWHYDHLKSSISIKEGWYSQGGINQECHLDYMGLTGIHNN